MPAHDVANSKSKALERALEPSSSGDVPLVDTVTGQPHGGARLPTRRQTRSASLQQQQHLQLPSETTTVAASVGGTQAAAAAACALSDPTAAEKAAAVAMAVAAVPLKATPLRRRARGAPQLRPAMTIAVSAVAADAVDGPSSCIQVDPGFMADPLSDLDPSGGPVAWRKVLWRDQARPDNYTDASFLEDLVGAVHMYCCTALPLCLFSHDLSVKGSKLCAKGRALGGWVLWLSTFIHT